MYKTLYMHKGILTSFKQSLRQLEAFIFFLGHVLKEEGWARGWTGEGDRLFLSNLFADSEF